MPISETRTYASITSPLSRMMSMTSARPLGRGRSRYPRGVAVAMAMGSSFASTELACSCLARLLDGQRLLAFAHQALTDVRPVLRQGARDLDLADAVQIADRPVELL